MPDFTITRGNDDTLEVVIYEPDGTTIRNITGADMRFTAKRHPDYAAALISKTINQGITITDGPNGKASIVLSPADTRDLPADVVLYYDVQTTQDGDTDTPIKGRLTVAADVTR